jgi:hypothetical protein
MPIDSELHFPFAGSVLVTGREQWSLLPELRVSMLEKSPGILSTP